jgi:hypothetical protein
MWKRAAVVRVEAVSQHSPEGSEEKDENPVRIVGVPSEIRNRNLPNTNQKRYWLNQLVRQN